MKSYKLVNFCEFDEYAVKAYCAIHDVDENLNLGDITKVNINNLPQCDILTHGSPCQDFSAAGLQKGGDEGSGTRSSLIWNSVKIIQHCNPKFVIWENVENVLSPKHIHNFQKYLKQMEELGYVNNYKVLNACDYGIPQTRKRIFCVSIKKEIYCGFEFPKPVPLRFSLEQSLDFREKDNLTKSFYNRYREIKNPNATIDNFVSYINSLPITNGIGGKKMGLYKFGEMDFITIPTGLTGTLTCRNIQNYNKKYWYNNKLYKPSPKMCFRLMGFKDIDYERCANALDNNDKQIYNRAGNSIVVDVAYYVMFELYKNYSEYFNDLNLISLFSGIGAFEKALDLLYKAINN